MTVTVDTVLNLAMVLPPDKRLSLACTLIESVEANDAPSPDAAWDVEIRDRIARYDAGGSTGIAAADLFGSLRQIAPAK